MLGGYLEFFMSPTIAEMYRSLRRELDELIHTKVSHCLLSPSVFNSANGLVHNRCNAIVTCAFSSLKKCRFCLTFVEIILN